MPTKSVGLARDGPVAEDITTFAKELAAEFLQRMKVFGEKFNSSTFYEDGYVHAPK